MQLPYGTDTELQLENGTERPGYEVARQTENT
jgi:hypothetical protein